MDFTKRIELFNLNIIQLEFLPTWSCVSLTQSTLQVSENYFDLTKWRLTIFKFLLNDVTI